MQEYIFIRCYSDSKEYIFYDFNPLIQKTEDIFFEEWHSYDKPLRIGGVDFARLLLPYFNKIFPVTDITNGEIQEVFDTCFDNWIDKESWLKFINLIELDLNQKPLVEIKFYQDVILWIKEALTTTKTNIIVVDSNL